jgi:zinc-ribbon domain
VTAALITGTALALIAMAIVLYPLFFPTEDAAAPRESGSGCARCGAALPPGARFCSQCGVSVEARR